MADTGVWSVAFIGWKSKADDVLKAVRKGKLDAFTGKGVHVRKGAQCVVLLEDGTILATGQVVNVAGYIHEVSLTGLVSDVQKAPQLSKGWLDKLKTVPKGFLKAPISGIIIVPDRVDAILDSKWFDDVSAFAAKSLGKAASTVPLPTREPAAPSHPASTEKKTPVAEAAQPGDERESLLRSWIPPALKGLLEDHVRADEWEVIVAYAFRALGCQVEVQGKKAAGKAEPDCIARYTSPAGQVIELVIDAKAGRWNAAVDDIRAMRDYLALSTPYSQALFVANALAKDVEGKLREHVMNGKTARAISGRDLALLICQRMTDPNFNVELELRRIFL